MAPTIGETLRKARTERGVELSEVERATKIRAKFLEAMEEDRWGVLPAPVYARGFLDIYARYLGLDQQALLDEYRQTVEGEQHEPIPQSVIKPGTLRQTRPVGRTRSINWEPVAKVLAGVIVVAVVGLVIVGSIGGSDDSGGSDKGGKARNQGSKAAGPSTPTTTTTSTAPAGEVSVELRATAPVWVCLVDDGGTPLVDSETLNADEARGSVQRRRVRRYPRERLGRDDSGRRAGSDSAGRGAARLPDHTDRGAEARPLLTAHLRLRSGVELSGALRQYQRPRAKPPNAINPIRITTMPIQTLVTNSRMIPMMTMMPPSEIPPIPLRRSGVAISPPCGRRNER